ncbi:uncharacterized protein sosie [Periplaneta americana]|uniref:uncharacterized protein sosie n=1 Tax=Periplaneta americana TaxID=6978 RepID=UPI0037E78FFF
MSSATSVSLLHTVVIPTVFFLFMVYYQADCIGLSNQKTARLTTFGSSSTTTKNNTHQTVQPKARACNGNSDCSGFPNSTCMKYPEDSKMYCLCGDKKPPIRGSCSHSKQGLHSICSMDEDCIPDAVCKAGNTTNAKKLCECKEGFMEEDYECSSGILTTVPHIEAIFLLILYPSLQLIY